MFINGLIIRGLGDDVAPGYDVRTSGQHLFRYCGRTRVVGLLLPAILTSDSVK